MQLEDNTVYVVTEHYSDEEWEEGFTRVRGVYRDKGVVESLVLSGDGLMLEIIETELK